MIEITTPDDLVKINARLDSIEQRLRDLAVEPPIPDPEPPIPEPETPVEPLVPIDTTAFYESLVAMPEMIKASTYKNFVNSQMSFDEEMQALKIRVGGSITIKNRRRLRLRVDGVEQPKTNGHLAAVWEFYPSQNWNLNNTTVSTHKYAMWGNFAADDRRMIEQRFHYRRVDGLDPEPENGERDNLWQIDTRPYSIGADVSGAGKGLDRMTPWQPQYAKVGQWNRFYSDVDLENETYSVWVRNTDGELACVYDQVQIGRSWIVGLKRGISFFDPTWINTSQRANDTPLTYGWVRNAVMLWSPTHLDRLEEIRNAPIE